jgi:hypothetical protein
MLSNPSLICFLDKRGNFGRLAGFLLLSVISLYGYKTGISEQYQRMNRTPKIDTHHLAPEQVETLPLKRVFYPLLSLYMIGNKQTKASGLSPQQRPYGLVKYLYKL